MMRSIIIFWVSLSWIELNNIKIPDILLSIWPCFHSNNLSIDRSHKLRIQVSVAELSLKSFPERKSLINSSFSNSFLLIYFHDKILDSMKNLISLSLSSKSKMNTIIFSIEIKSVFKKTDIPCYLNMTVLIEIYSHQLFICQLFINQNSQIWK